MIEKKYQTQFFENFMRSDNLLIINVLQHNPLFPPLNVTKNPLTFKFLFRHTIQTINYTLLNISVELCCLHFCSPVLFQKIYAENFSKVLSF